MSLRNRLWHMTALMPLWLASPPSRVVVLPVDLNDVSNQPVPPELRERLGMLTEALSSRLQTACGYAVIRPSQSGDGAGDARPGYLYAHPDVAIGFARPASAEWVIIPRLNRASPWVTDLQAHVVRTRDSTVVSNRIVEVKGIELTPELGARLVDRGAAWMADQISQAIEYASARTRPAGRRCPA